MPDRFRISRVGCCALIGAIAGLAACSSPHQGLTPTLSGAAARTELAARATKTSLPCSAYKTYGSSNGGNGNEGQGYSIRIVDDSGLAAATKKQAYLYLEGGGSFLNALNGTWTTWLGTASPPPSKYEYPLSCLTTNKATYYLPPVPSARLYISYGHLHLNATAMLPNGAEAPGIPTGYSNPNFSTHWDYWEYTYTPASQGAPASLGTDTSAVDGFGLPLYVTLKHPQPGNLAAYGTGKYAQILSAFEKNNVWSNLIVWGCTNAARSSTTCTPAKPAPDAIPYRILSPSDATNVPAPPGKLTNVAAFPVDYFYNNAYFQGPGGVGYDGGYLGAIEQYFHNAKNAITFIPYQLSVESALGVVAGCDTKAANNVVGAVYQCPLYKAHYSTSKKAFVFHLLPTPSPAPIPIASLGSFPSEVVLPAKIFKEQYTSTYTFNCVSSATCASTPGNGIWNNSGIQCPLPTSGVSCADSPYSLQVPFFLYKALAADLTRGVAKHRTQSVLPCQTKGVCNLAWVAPLYYGQNYYPSSVAALFSIYGQILHANFHNGWTYANSYDDYFDQSSSSSENTSANNGGITITIAQTP